MLKALIRKQLLEINKGFVYDYKKGKNRSKKGIIGFIIFYAFIMVGILGGTFGAIGYLLAQAFVPAGLGWLYFDIMMLIAVVLGIFGTVFNTYASLYTSKDNDLLLSMPIPVRNIMISRLFSVYIMDILYSGVVIIPTLIMYYIFAVPSLGTIVGPIVLSLLVTVFVMVLSIALGWVVAKISSKLKNKSIISAFIALAGIGIYYVVYFKAVTKIQAMILNIQDVFIEIKGATKIAYIIGSTGEGVLSSVLIMTAVVAALTVLVLTVLNRTFIKIVTTQTGSAKIKYKEKSLKTRTVAKAIYAKEMGRFVASSTYMLNCGLGSVIMIIGAVVVLIKGQSIGDAFGTLFSSRPSALGVCLAGAMMFALSMVNTTAASISLEGKNMWLYQSLPVRPMDVLLGKLKVHLTLSAPSVLLILAVCIAMKVSFFQTILLLVFTISSALLFGQLGLILNLMKPNFNWTDETMVVKQSFGVFLSMFGGWALGMLVIVSGLWLTKFVPGLLLLIVWTALTILTNALFNCWLKTKGSVIFQNL